MATNRKTEHPVDKIFTNRWSPRSFTGETMPEEDLLTMFEAARWAHSSSNGQPWRFSYVMRGDAEWERYVDFLVPFNAGWAKDAAALVIVLSATHTEATDDKPSRPIASHSLDTGAALQSFTLQASLLGYVAHPMGGVEHDKIKQAFGIAEGGYAIQAAIAVGKQGPADKLPDSLKAREMPSDRKPLSEIVFKGGFKA